MPIQSQDDAKRLAQWAVNNPDDPRRAQVIQAIRDWDSQAKVTPVQNQQGGNPLVDPQTQADLAARQKSLATLLPQIASEPKGNPLVDLKTRTLNTMNALQHGFVPSVNGKALYNSPLASNDPMVMLEADREHGYDIDTGTSLSVRFMSALADVDKKNPEFKLLALEKMLRPQAKIPDNVPVLVRTPYSNKLAYLRRVTEDDVKSGRDPAADLGKLRPTLLNVPGVDLGDIAAVVPEGGHQGGIISADALTAAGVAAVAGGAPTSVAVGLGAIAGGLVDTLTRPARVWAVKHILGITDEDIQKDIADKGVQGSSLGPDWLSGATTAGLSMLGAAGFGIYRLRAAKGRPLTPEDLKNMLLSIDKGKQDLKRIHDKTGILIVDPEQEGLTQGAMYGSNRLNVELKAREKDLNPEHRRQLIAQQMDERQRAAAAVKSLSSPSADPGPHTNLTLDQLGEKTQQVLHQPLDEAAAAVEKQQAALDNQLEAFPRTNGKELYTSVQNATQAAVAKADEYQSGLWEKFDQMTGGRMLANPKDGPIFNYARKLVGDIRNSLLKSSGTRAQALLEDIEPMLNSPVLDFRRLSKAQSLLKRTYRQLTTNPQSQLGWDANDVKGLLDAIQTQVTTGELMPKPGSPGFGVGEGLPLTRRIRAEERDAITEQYNLASRATLEFKQTQQAAAVRDLLQLKQLPGGGARFEKLPSQVEKLLFTPHNASTLWDVYEAAGDNPALKAALAEELQNKFIAETGARDVFNPRAAEDFRSKYQDHMDLLFGPDNAAKINNVETMAMQVKKLQNQATAIQKTIKDNFGSIVADSNSAYSSNLIDHMMSGGSNAKQVKNVIDTIDKVDPGLGSNLRLHAGKWVESKLLSGKVPKGSGSFTEVVRKYGDKLAAIYGKDYPDDLSAIGRVISLGERPGAAPKDAPPTWLNVTRSLFGPMDKIQRRFTVANKIVRSLGANRALEITNNPELLHKWVRLQKVDPRSLAFSTAAIAILGPDLAKAYGISQPQDNTANMPATVEQLRALVPGL